ncbi:hypothetical protein CR513_30978 [Mucuna pruriens]|uniref:Uncharacterized protein n=1 Tax=Mucuna pruriens TaxID=157652 RepID=A0A371GAE6_MUCPR|nr:hypothetical protein CR513_30978 [Mucuna pruriens]
MMLVRRSLRYPFLLALTSLHLQLLSGLANNPSDAKNENKDHASRSSVGLKIIIICLAVVTVIAFSVFLFKLWQRKKREEQHARLLKLFEDDDELEIGELNALDYQANNKDHVSRTFCSTLSVLTNFYDLEAAW